LGAFEQKFNSVSNESSTALKLEGGTGHFAFHLDGLYRDNNNIDISGNAIDASRAQVSEPGLVVTDNTNGFINNSQSRTKTGTAGASIVGDRGFFGFSINELENRYGIPPDGSAGSEISVINQEQSRYDIKGELKNPVSFLETVRTRLGFTDYQHTEGDEALFQNDTFEGRIEAPHKPVGNLNGVVGFQAITSKFSAVEIKVNEFLVPITISNNFSFFAQEELAIGDTTTEFGIRVEHATVNPRGAGNPDKDYTPVSASVSELWDINVD